MKILSRLVLIVSFSFVAAEDAPTTVERRSMEVPKQFVGKTLSEIGLIVELKTDTTKGKELTDSATVFDVLRESRITPRSKLEVSLASELPPHIEIRYEDGTVVSANRYDAFVKPADGNPFFCYLLQPEEPPEPLQIDFLHLKFDKGFADWDLEVRIGENKLLGAFSPSTNLGSFQWSISQPNENVSCIISSVGRPKVLKWKFDISVSKGKYLWFDLSDGNLLYAQLPQPYFLYGNDVSNKASILTPDPQ